MLQPMEPIERWPEGFADSISDLVFKKLVKRGSSKLILQFASPQDSLFENVTSSVPLATDFGFIFSLTSTTSSALPQSTIYKPMITPIPPIKLKKHMNHKHGSFN